MSLATQARTALALGVPNLARAFSYRLRVKSGLTSARRLRGEAPCGPFFAVPSSVARDLPLPETWQTHARLFSYWPIAVSDAPPDWHCNLLTGKRIAAPEREWWRIPDFDPAVGDIKLIWEASRFDWVIAHAQRLRGGDAAAVARLNDWLEDWCRCNPPYCGPNWKCGQEASIRVMHLAMATVLLGQSEAPLPSLLELVRLHLQRIEPTIAYAVSQDNNHGTSEAAALFIGGSWLARNGLGDGVRWEALGRKWLENRAARLIGDDGSFSQYSVTYHRVMLDTFCMVEVWRRRAGLPAFSERWRARTHAATRWLRTLVRVENGDAPNVGANDGARLLQLTDTDYRDFRPSVQLAAALFEDGCAYAEDGPWNLPLRWLGVEVPTRMLDTLWSNAFDEGGFAVLHNSDAMALLRYPRFRYRPSQADALHLDLWLGKRNLLRDAGTYSYNTEAQWLNYFPGTAGHNTVQFDDRDQMPRLSRFLFGDWLKTRERDTVTDDGTTVAFGAAYRDCKGAYHRRRVSLRENWLRVEDRVEGFARKAVLRWRLEPGDWWIEGNTVRNGKHYLRVEAGEGLVRFALVTGWESRYYLEKTEVPVLEVEVNRAGTLISEYCWAP
ncbi:heparinase II/III family protein [Aromatoleum buckelii]|uniref:Heparinase n=1 Tax=Aromatoleum buckelii TaxID=200254 RepID=A0ABX1N5R0_9RHOO|nr:heparinase II/III-family protein [Aromatoleum buckelii]MCK0512717.1 heparinase II/III-family protein [Aromatoleum buckelii]